MKRYSMYWVSVIVFLILSCATGKRIMQDPSAHLDNSPAETPVYSIYAVGDAGAWNAQSQDVIKTLAQVTADDVQPGAIVFLGDNIYPHGLAPESDTANHGEGRRILTRQLEMLSAYNGEIIFIPGNHDWNGFKAGGLEAIKRQQALIEDYDHPLVSFYPQNGCAGPIIREINDHIVLIIIDSQWWFQNWKKEPGINEGCDVQSREDLMEKLGHALEPYRGRQLVFLTHHPLESRGPHGGFFTLRDHLFPLSKVVRWLYLPLPVVGSIYPWYRTIIGHPQDQVHPRYKAFRDGILQAIVGHEPVIFLSGHDHNLQYLRAFGHHMIVSGSGAKQIALANGRELRFGHKIGGFFAVHFYQDKSVILEVYEVGSEIEGHIVYREIIKKSV